MRYKNYLVSCAVLLFLVNMLSLWFVSDAEVIKPLGVFLWVGVSLILLVLIFFFTIKQDRSLVANNREAAEKLDIAREALEYAEKWADLGENVQSCLGERPDFDRLIILLKKIFIEMDAEEDSVEQFFKTLSKQDYPSASELFVESDREQQLSGLIKFLIKECGANADSVNNFYEEVEKWRKADTLIVNMRNNVTNKLFSQLDKSDFLKEDAKTQNLGALIRTAAILFDAVDGYYNYNKHGDKDGSMSVIEGTKTVSEVYRECKKSMSPGLETDRWIKAIYYALASLRLENENISISGFKL